MDCAAGDSCRGGRSGVEDSPQCEGTGLGSADYGGSGGPADSSAGVGGAAEDDADLSDGAGDGDRI